MDIIKDKSFQVFTKLARRIGYPLPDYVAKYTPDYEKIASELPDEEFACPALREYPVDCKAAAWLSAMYAAESLSRGGKEARAAEDALCSIKAAAIAWGNIDDVEQVIDSVKASMRKQAADSDDNYGWIDRDTNGAVVARRYGIFDAAGVVKAANYFLENRDSYHYRTREKIARFILRKADSFGVPQERLDREIEKEAGFGLPVKELVMQEIDERARLAKHAECGALLANVNKLLAVCVPSELPATMDKVATLINEFDIAEDLTQHYGKRITRPADFLYGLPVKLAEDLSERAVKVGSAMFDAVKLAEAVPAREFYMALGPGFVNTILESGTFNEDDLGATVKVSAAKLKTALGALPQGRQRELHRHLVSLCEQEG